MGLISRMNCLAQATARLMVERLKCGVGRAKTEKKSEKLLPINLI